jgi:hypothetical protein
VPVFESNGDPIAILDYPYGGALALDDVFGDAPVWLDAANEHLAAYAVHFWAVVAKGLRSTDPICETLDSKAT